MDKNRKSIDMEAFLDEELTAEEMAAFSAVLAGDPDLQAELAARRRDRLAFREALGEEIPAVDLDLSDQTHRDRRPGRGSHRTKPNHHIRLALAASICLVILMPGVLRNNKGAKGPRSAISVSGQVAVVRYGEKPGETTMLATGAFELPAELSR